MLTILSFALLLFVVYLGYVFGVILGLISPEEMDLFQKLKINTPFLLALFPFAIFIIAIFYEQYLVLTSSICFFLGLVLGSKELSAFVVKKELTKINPMLKNALYKSIPYMLSALILIYYYFFYIVRII